MHRFITKTAAATGIATLLVCSAPAFAIANVHAVAAQAAAETRLQDAKLKACQKHEAVINKIMANIAERGQKRLGVYTTIATRVEDFYTKKSKTVTNYDTLVADVNTKKTAAQDAIDKIKTDKANFKCDGTDPKGVAQGFKDDLKLEIQALHAYQQSIKDLIVAVKSVQSDATPDNSTNSSNSDNTTTGGNQ
ncbi:MAG TPA: hypothetical protein VLE51_02815 [Candidatus Saccharimonadales bacterium]|nr:hypothetical protein [Candidatus Saccharimonadales bacterium]